MILNNQDPKSKIEKGDKVIDTRAGEHRPHIVENVFGSLFTYREEGQVHYRPVKCYKKEEEIA